MTRRKPYPGVERRTYATAEATVASYVFAPASRAGMVFVNAVVIPDARLPFSGMKPSGHGRELGESSIAEFTALKSIAHPLPPEEDAPAGGAQRRWPSNEPPSNVAHLSHRGIGGAMSTLTRTARRSVLFALALTLMLAVAACGSSSNDKSTSSAQSKPTASAAAAVPAYQGAEQKFIGTLPPAQQKQGASPTIGFLQVFGGQQVLVATQKAFTDEIKSLGGKVTVLDAKLDPQKQVSQFDQLFAQGVDAIAVMPANVDAIQRSLQEAKKRKIPVVGFQDPVDLSQPPNKYLVTTVNAGYDYAAYKTMGDLAQKSPKSTFAILGSAIPNSSLQFITDRIKFWGEKLGLKFVGRQDSKTDLPTGMAPAAQAILTRYPDVKNIVAYNDQAALAAIAAAREAGKLDGIKVATTNSGQDVAGQAIKQGRMQSGYYVPWAELGKLMARAAYNAATKQATNMPNAVVPKSNLVTKANVDQFSFFH